MKVTFKNIGPIREAEVDLSKDLIVLCGGNNTGKTFLAYAVYGLIGERESFFSEFRKEFESYLNDNKLIQSPFKIDLYPFMNRFHDKAMKSFRQNVKNALPSIFSAAKSVFTKSSVAINLKASTIIEKLKSNQLDELELVLFPGTSIRMAKEVGTLFMDISFELSPDKVEDLQRSMARLIFALIYADYFPWTYFAPAERFAINIFSRELSYRRSRAIDFLRESLKNGYVDNIANYPLPIKDALAFAQEMGFPQVEERSFAYLADRIESEILKGKLSTDEHGNVQYQPGHLDHSVGIHLSASLVKSLTSIVFYLRYRAQKGDLYIIDEPELNLHPDNQRKVARVLAEMVNAGIKVMISTHSDYIVKELNNLVMLASAEDQKTAASLSEQYGYRKEQLLSPEKVGAYLFSLSEGVKQLEVSNTGFSVETIDEQINELNQSSDDIYFKLHFE